ncbi:MAG: hypothetical protein Q9N26_08135 [Aquificota bacterium]|nr:hypothetical protein [Aquificota bacterium]
MKTVQIRLDNEVYKTLAKTAIDNDTTIGKYVRSIVLDSLDISEGEEVIEVEEKPAPSKRRRRKS